MRLRAPNVVLIDALGTILALEPPAERIDPSAVAGIPGERVREAFAAEMAYYRAHSEEGRDAESLADLRRRCAAVLSEHLGREVEVGTLIGAIQFHPYPDAAPALDRLRERGLSVICVSNWDCSLPEVLGRVGLAGRFDSVITSAAVGARKPDPAIFEAALAAAGRDAAEAVHIGDSDEDVAGARAAGIDVLRIDRDGVGDPGAIHSLRELEERLP